MNVYVISSLTESNIMYPTLSQVIEVVRQSSGHHRKRIDEKTLIEADLDICGMDGDALIEDCEAAFGVIHVHHITPLSEIGERYKLDPVKDLRPVCPNCHAMIHRQKPSLTIEELKALMTKAQKENESAQSKLTQ